MAANEIHVGDIGTVLRCTIKDGSDAVNISTATSKIIILEDPSGNNSDKIATFTTNGIDGKIQYTTISGDFDERGNWSIQAKVVLPSGTWYSDIYTFEVHGNL
jgi:hypothetical protein